MIAGGFGRASTGPSGAMAKSAVVRAYPLVRPAVASFSTPDEYAKSLGCSVVRPKGANLLP